MGEPSRLELRRRGPSRALALVATIAIGCNGPILSTSAPIESSTAEASPSPDASPTGTLIASASPTATSTPTTTDGPDPTYEPEPTPEGAYPLRTKVQINDHVVDRAGVPTSLYDSYWWTWNGDGGQVGTTAQIGLPTGELIETIGSGIVVAVRLAGDDPWAEHDIVVRDFTSGRLIREIRTDLRWLDVVLVGSQVFWTGVLAGDPEDVVDGGVWTTDVRRDDDPVAIVEPGRVFPGALCGMGLEVSPSGRTLSAHAVCNGPVLGTDIIDTETKTRTIRLREQWVLALTDDTYVRADFRPTDGVTWGQGGVSAFGIADGALRWRFPDPADVDRFTSGGNAALGSSFVIRYFWRTEGRGEMIHAVLDAATGHQRVLLRQPYEDDSLYAEFPASSASHLLMTTGHDLGTQLRLRGTPISIIRLDDGALVRDAFEIDPPWLCYDEYCREDT